MTRTYSKEQWTARRALIETLYVDRGLTMDQVRDHLCGEGFMVNTRMVKTRLLNWGLHKRLSLHEIHTALRLIGPRSCESNAPTVMFRIRQKLVSLEQVIRSCHRRGIADPFSWSQTLDGIDQSPADVELLMFSDYQRENSVSSFNNGDDRMRPLEDFRSDALALFTEVTGRHSPHRSCSRPQVPRTIFEPRLLELPDTDSNRNFTSALHEIRSFCFQYVVSLVSIDHEEPIVHQDTTHAHLQSHINHGIFEIYRGNTNAAFESFKLGSEILEDVLRDINPMSIAMYLLLLCKLSVNTLGEVAATFLRQAINLARTYPGVPETLCNTLHAIYKSDSLMHISLTCLRVMSELKCIEESARWKSFYVQERYCDALYYARLTEQGSSKRVALLESQIQHYGPFARNVLVTSLNVAEDWLEQGRLFDAHHAYQQILQRSHMHDGYHRAKIQISALMGLVRVSLVRRHPQRDTTTMCCSPAVCEIWDDRTHSLAAARSLVNRALRLAHVWYVDFPRRMQALHDLQSDVERCIWPVNPAGDIRSDIRDVGDLFQPLVAA